MTLAVCAKDVKFYNWSHMTYLATYETPPDCISVKSATWSSDGKELLIIKSKGDPVVVKSPRKCEDINEASSNLPLGHNVSAGTFSTNNRNLLVFGFESGDTTGYDLENRNVLRYQKLPTGIQSLDYSSDDNHLVAGCIDGSLYLYDSKYKVVATYIVPNSQTLSTCGFSKYNPNLLAGTSKDGAVSVWDIETGDRLLYSKSHASRVTDLVFKEQSLSTVATDGNFCIFDFRSNCIANKYDMDGALSSLAYINDGELGVSTYNQLRCYDTRNMYSPVHTLLLNNGGNIRKIAYADNTEDVEKETYLNQCFWKKGVKKPERDTLSASGDFSLNANTSSQVNIVSTGPCIKEPEEIKDDSLNTPSSIEEVTLNPEQITCQRDIVKIADETAKQINAEYSEQLARSFYSMRMNTSKKFIYLEDKINESWNNFIDYLKCSGAASIYDIDKTAPTRCSYSGTRHDFYEEPADDS